MEEIAFGPWLRQQRQALGLTQQAMAVQIGYAAETIRKLEAGRRRPTTAMLLALSESLQLSPPERQALLNHHVPSTSAPSQPESSPLPTPITSFVGREDDLRRIEQMLTQEHVRLLTLSGPPGVGKTRLAIALAQRMALTFTNAVHYLSLSKLTEPGQVLPTLVEALDIASGGAAADRVLASALRTTPCLLILDGCDHVLAAAPDLMRLIEQTAALQIVVTSRTPLHLYGEQEYPVPCLSLINQNHLAAGRSDALALLVDRLRAVRPNIALTDEAIVQLTTLTQLLDGLPLALELAAGQMRYLTPGELVRQLQDVTATAALLDRAGPEIPSFRNMLATSLDSLSPSTRHLFMMAGIFHGGWTAPALQALVQRLFSGEATNLSEVVVGLQRLIDAGLVRADSQPDLTEPRFRMLHPLRAYAIDFLCRAGLHEAARQAHTTYFHEMAEALHRQSEGRLPPIWLARLAEEADNLIAAMHTAREQSEAEVGLRIGLALYFHWMHIGQHVSGRQWLVTFLADAHIATATRARATYCAGFLAFRLGDYLQARDDAWESLQLARQQQLTYATANALFLLALIALEQQSFEAAEAALAECVILRQQLHDTYGLGNAILMQGSTHLYWGHYHQALDLYQQAKAVIDQQDDPVQQAAVLGNMGLAHLELSEYARATQLIEAALALFRAQSHQADIAYATLNLAYGAALQGQWGDAQRLVQEGVALLQALGDEGTLPEAKQTLAYVAYHQGHLHEAWDLYQESLKQSEDIAEIRRIPVALLGMGKVASALGWWDTAQTLLQECLALQQQREHSIGLAEIRDAQADLAMSQQQPKVAATYFQEATTIRAAYATPRHFLEEQRYQHQMALLNVPEEWNAPAS